METLLVCVLYGALGALIGHSLVEAVFSCKQGEQK